MRNEIKAGHQLEAIVLTSFLLTLFAGFVLGWVAHFWVHRG